MPAVAEKSRDDAESVDRQIDAWKAATERLTGEICEERKPWVTEVTADAVRHFAQGTDDNNPLWTDSDYAAASIHHRLMAPPAFVFAQRYPILHGAPQKAPLASLIGGVEVEWFKPIMVGDRLCSEPRQKEFYDKRNKQGRRLNFVISEVTYSNQNQDVVAKAVGTMIMATQVGLETMMEHEIPKFTQDDLHRFEETWRKEYRRGGKPLYFEDVAEGEELPSILRGPLTIGDMVCWNSAIGPSYKAGSWGYLDLTKSMHTAMFNPVTGFPVKYSQQHEDPNMAAGRGMPAPFDNGVMRFAWVAPLVTNWIGDHGFLRRLDVQVRRPGLYGDVTVYAGKVVSKDAGSRAVRIEITGKRQDGLVNTAGAADVVLPPRR
jgi:acyl dehydratase